VLCLGASGPLEVVSTSPAANATGASTNNPIVATFSEAVDPTSVTPASFSLSASGVAVPGTVSATDDTASFAPEARLCLLREHTATITTAVKGDGTWDAEPMRVRACAH
jgi:hypothetical protein